MLGCTTCKKNAEEIARLQKEKRTLQQEKEIVQQEVHDLVMLASNVEKDPKAEAHFVETLFEGLDEKEKMRKTLDILYHGFRTDRMGRLKLAYFVHNWKDIINIAGKQKDQAFTSIMMADPQDLMMKIYYPTIESEMLEGDSSTHVEHLRQVYEIQHDEVMKELMVLDSLTNRLDQIDEGKRLDTMQKKVLGQLQDKLYKQLPKYTAEFINTERKRKEVHPAVKEMFVKIAAALKLDPQERAAAMPPIEDHFKIRLGYVNKQTVEDYSAGRHLSGNEFRREQDLIFQRLLDSIRRSTETKTAEEERMKEAEIDLDDDLPDIDL